MPDFWNKDGTIDISLIEDRRGKVEMHKPNCKYVLAAREAGRAIFNLFGCKGMPEGVLRCECLEGEAE